MAGQGSDWTASATPVVVSGLQSSEADSRFLDETAEGELRMRFAASVITTWNESFMKDSGRVCIARDFFVPQGIVVRAFQSMALYPCPGELPQATIVAALKRFDTAFDIDRGDFQRQAIVAELKRSTEDPTRVHWHDPILFQAFSVRLNVYELVYFTLDVSDSSSLVSRLVSAAMVLLILLSITLWMAGTEPDVMVTPCTACEPRAPAWMKDVDEVIVCVFTLEVWFKLYTVASARIELLQPMFLSDLITKEEVAVPNYCTTPGLNKVFQFLRSPAAICDLLAVLPFWIETLSTAAQVNFPLLRLLKVLRVSRVFKLMRLLNMDLGLLSDVNSLLVSVTANALPAALMTMILVLFALVTFSGLIHTAERGDWYPHSKLLELSSAPGVYNGPTDKGQFIRCRRDGVCSTSPFASMAEAAWWTLTTVTTVGYGDIVPMTVAGKVVGTMAIMYGTILLGLPIGIIGSQFSNEFTRTLNSSRMRKELVRHREELAEIKHARESVRITQEQMMAEGLGEAAPRPQKRRSVMTQLTGRLSLRRRTIDEDGPYALDMGSKQADLEDMQQMVRLKFEGVMQSHGEKCGVSVDQQRRWAKALLATHMRGCPALDRLGIRVLTTLSEAEDFRPISADSVAEIRQAWHTVVVACCEFAEMFDRDRPATGPVYSRGHTNLSLHGSSSHCLRETCTSYDRCSSSDVAAGALVVEAPH